MYKVLGTFSAASLLMLLVAAPSAAQEQSRFGVLASEWDSATVPVASVIVPVGGSGQVNGGFVTGERYGVQVGIRAQERFAGPILPVSRSKQTGVYQASTGFSTGANATWNYDLHIDLRNAQGVAAGKTLGDYTLVLDSDISTSFFGCTFPCDLSSGLPSTIELFQTSQNPKFGNPSFDATVEDFVLLYAYAHPQDVQRAGHHRPDARRRQQSLVSGSVDHVIDAKLVGLVGRVEGEHALA